MGAYSRTFAPDRMRVALAIAAVRGKDTKATVCMVRTVLQEKAHGKPKKEK